MKTYSNFEKISKKSKQKSRIKTIIWSVTLALVAVALITKGLTELTSRNGNRILERYNYLNQVAYPNILYKNYYFEASGLFSGEFTSDRVKNIDGIEVPFEPMEKSYSITQIASHDDNSSAYWDSEHSGVYTRGQQLKVPVFYNTNYGYKDKEMDPPITKDLSLVEKMSNQAAEVAVTFDKPYTYKEIQKMIPENVLINWYWIGSKSHFDTTGFDAQDTLGIMSFDEGKLTSQEFMQFRQDLKKGLKMPVLQSSYGMTTDNGKSYRVSIKSEVKNYLKDNKNFKDATFSGVIISGRTENLAKLKNKNWIFASNIGQSIEIQPYHKLTK